MTGTQVGVWYICAQLIIHAYLLYSLHAHPHTTLSFSISHCGSLLIKNKVRTIEPGRGFSCNKTPDSHYEESLSISQIIISVYTVLYETRIILTRLITKLSVSLLMVIGL